MARVVLKSAGFREMLNSGEVRALLTAKAENVLAAAQAAAPVDTGAYKAGLHTEQATTDRAVVRVVSGDFKGHILEANYGILSRALDSA